MPSFICCLHAAYAGNIQKAQPSAFRNSIKFLSLCSRLFLCNPIVMHWSWNQSPAVHAASVWFQTVGAEREDSHNNSIDSAINKRERENIENPGPWSSRGDHEETWADRSGAGVSREAHSGARRPERNMCLKITEKIESDCLSTEP